jgi:hypothetical protein
MICNNFLFGSNSKDYCKGHINKHPDKDDTMMQTFKVRYYPSKEQRNKLKHYFGCSRFTYNKCVQENYTNSLEIIRNEIVTCDSKSVAYEKLLYKQIDGNILGELKLIKDALKCPVLTYNTLETRSFIEKNSFLTNCPKEIRTFGVKEYLTGYKESLEKYNDKIKKNNWKKQQNIILNKKKYKIKKIKDPEMKFRTKKGEQSITINKDSIHINNNKITIYPEAFDENPLIIRNKCYKKDKKLKKLLEGCVVYHDVKIIKTKTNEYYLCITTDEKKEHPVIDENNNGSYDPGGRIFLTGYICNKADGANEIMEIGTGMNSAIGAIYKQIDENKKILGKLYGLLLEKLDENEKEIVQNKIDYRVLKHKKLHRKLRNMVDDMHNKAITKLLINDVTYIPELNTTRIVKDKKYPRQAKRILSALRHRSFIKNLLNKGELKDQNSKRTLNNKTMR